MRMAATARATASKSERAWRERLTGLLTSISPLTKVHRPLACVHDLERLQRCRSNEM